MKTTVFVVFLMVLTAAAADAQLIQYVNSTGSTIYELDAPTSWAIANGQPNVILPGAGPNGGDAYYRPGAVNGQDDGTIAYWNFTGAALANVGHNLAGGLYYVQVYVSATSNQQDTWGWMGSWNARGL